MSGVDRERRGYFVRGQVQGVGFRWWTVQQARDLGLVGLVRNESDGSVRVEAAGDLAALEEFEERLRRGPAGAQVETVERRAPGGGPFPESFRIDR